MTKLVLSLEQIESNLDSGCLKAPTTSGTTWMVKRNGRTRTWKRDPMRFEIPVKVGFREYSTIDQNTTFGTDLLHDYKVIPTAAELSPNLFQYHNCSVCKNGKLPCTDSVPGNCGNPIAHND